MKRKTKKLPDYLFAPKPIRVLAILQLCAAFVVLCWFGIAPFVQNYFSTQSQSLLIKSITGTREGAAGNLKAQINRNQERFKELSSEDQSAIINYSHWLKQQNSYSFYQTAKSVLEIFFFKISPFTQAWIFFSIAICILLLLRIEGAAQAALILPFILIIYCLSIQLQPQGMAKPSNEDLLFPSEEFVVQEYLKESLSKKIMEQRKQLLKGWQHYVITEWAREVPSQNEEVFNQQVEKGEFAFALARLNAQQKDYLTTRTSSKAPPASPLLVILGILWSIGFAWGVNRRQFINK